MKIKNNPNLYTTHIFNEILVLESTCLKNKKINPVELNGERYIKN